MSGASDAFPTDFKTMAATLRPLIGGFVVLILSLGYLATPITHLFEYGLQAMLGHFVPNR